MIIKECGGAVTLGRMRSNSNDGIDDKPIQSGTTGASYFSAALASSSAQERPLDSNGSNNGYFSATNSATQNTADATSHESQAELLQKVHNRKDLTPGERMMQKAGIKAGFRFDEHGNLVF